MKKLITLVILSLCLTNLFGANRKSNDDLTLNLNYSLPESHIDFNIDLERKVYSKGIFSQFAVKYLGISTENIILEDKEDWSLINIDIDTRQESDPACLYTIETQSDYEALKFNLSPDGFLAGFNSNYNFIIEESKANFVIAKAENPEPQILEFFCIDRPFKIVQDTTVTFSDEDGTVQERSKIKGKRLAKSLEQKAADAAHEIFKLRKRRFKILTSNYENLPADAASYQIVVEQLARLEKHYLELFVGRINTYTISKQFTYLPKAGEDTKVIARYSPRKGFVDNKDLLSLPIIVEINDIQVDKEIKELKATKDKRAQYIKYRVPARVNLEIYEAKTLVAKKSMIIPQLGKISSLSLDIIMEQRLSVDFYPQYGSLKRIYKSQQASTKN